MSAGGVAVARVLWGIVTPAYIAVQLVVVSAWPVPYELLHHTVSDLGWTECTVELRPVGILESCSPRHALFNVGTGALSMLLAIGGIALRPLYAGRRRTRWILATWIAIGAGGVATALVPGNVDIGLHALLAIPLFVGQPLVLVLTAISLRRSAPVLAVAAGVAAAVSVAGAVALGFALAGHGPVGIAERLAAETIYVWILVVALIGAGSEWSGTDRTLDAPPPIR